MKGERARSCPSCHAPVAGAFCSSCGQAVGSSLCPQCRAVVPVGSAFCPNCGVLVGGGQTAGRSNDRSSIDRVPWIVAGLAAATALVAISILLLRPPGGAPAVRIAGDATPPDISQMSPRDRFNALFDRVMRAVEGGDTVTVLGFSPMALLAYDQLPSVDADARYHAALIHLYGGDPEGARRLADSIFSESPDHLFGIVIQGAIAELEGDQDGLDQVYARYRGAYDREVAAGRTEYLDHQIILDRYRDASQVGARIN